MYALSRSMIFHLTNHLRRSKAESPLLSQRSAKAIPSWSIKQYHFTRKPASSWGIKAPRAVTGSGWFFYCSLFNSFPCGFHRSPPLRSTAHIVLMLQRSCCGWASVSLFRHACPRLRACHGSFVRSPHGSPRAERIRQTYSVVAVSASRRACVRTKPASSWGWFCPR